MAKILIAYTAHTIGHKKIGENIAYWFRQAGHEVVMYDALQAEKQSVGWFLSLHTLIYQHCGFIWKWLYDFGYKPLLPFRKLAAKKHSAKFLSVLEVEKPNLVITTQTSPSAVMAYLRDAGKFTGKWLIAFSDYHFHPFWHYKGADGYLINIPEQVNDLIARGVNAQRIYIGGMWLPPKENIDAGNSRRNLAISNDAKVVLISAGSGGWADFSSVITAVNQTRDEMSSRGQKLVSIVVCGNNAAKLSELQNMPETKGWKILGWQDNMAALYAISSVYITKPGGLSIAEALQWQLPCLVPFLLPGQENLNVNYLSGRGLMVNLMAKSTSDWPSVILAAIDENWLIKGKESVLCRENIVKSIDMNSFSSFIKGILE